MKRINLLTKTPTAIDIEAIKLTAEAAKELRKLRNELLILDDNFDSASVNKLILKLKNYGK